LLFWSSRQGSDAYQTNVVEARPNLLELLTLFPSCQPDMAHLLSELPPLLHRLYSISNAPQTHANTVHIALSLVEYEAPSSTRQARRGLCTAWLHDLCRTAGVLADTRVSTVAPNIVGYERDSTGSVCVAAFIKKSQHFRVPEDNSKPLVMVGPGTGVAPFLGFLQHRQAQLPAINAGGAALGSWRGLDLAEVEANEDDVDDDGGFSRVAPRRRLPAASVAPACVPSIPKMAECILFAGGRTRSTDFLYQEEFTRLQVKFLPKND
jgi:sulfite reductase alpha subunit-like flavoprotein